MKDLREIVLRNLIPPFRPVDSPAHRRGFDLQNALPSGVRLRQFSIQRGKKPWAVALVENVIGTVVKLVAGILRHEKVPDSRFHSPPQLHGLVATEIRRGLRPGFLLPQRQRRFPWTSPNGRRRLAAADATAPSCQPLRPVRESQSYQLTHFSVPPNTPSRFWHNRCAPDGRCCRPSRRSLRHTGSKAPPCSRRPPGNFRRGPSGL